MKVAIFGAGSFGQKLLPHLEEVVAFVDNSPEIQGSTIQQTKVLTVKQLKEMQETGEVEAVLVAVTSATNRTEIILQLLEHEIHNLYVAPAYLFAMPVPPQTSIWEACIPFRQTRPELHYLEVWVSDSCNLNCKGCGNFCNLVEQNQFADLEQYKRDIAKLAELFDNINTIRLMGGEPLLNPQLAEFVVATREAFPQATIRIVTNGLLVRQMTEALCRVLRLQHVIFDISNYPVLEGKCYQIAKFLYEERIPFRFSQPIHQFFKKLKLEGKSDPILANKNCIARTCHFMRDGKISHCGFQQSIQRFGKRFNIELPESQDIYDIYAEELDAWTLCGKLEQPVDLCCFCAEQDVYFDWEIRGRDAIPEDWLVE